MAWKYGYRWKPKAFSSTLETVVEGRDLAADPPQLGRKVRVLEAVVYDDTKVGTAGNPYRPGDPATEQYIEPADSAVIHLEVSAFIGLTGAQAEALWNQARDAQIAAWEATPNAGAYVTAAIGAARSGIVVR